MKEIYSGQLFQARVKRSNMKTFKTFLESTNGYYYIGANPTVDLVVIRGQEVLLIKRKSGGVEGGKWAIPGGFIETTAKAGQAWVPGKETPKEAALRELWEETGLRISSAIKMRFLGVYEGGGRDPRDTKESWSRSHAFVVTLTPEYRGFSDADSVVSGKDDASDARWFAIGSIPALAFDHNKIIKKALGK